MAHDLRDDLEFVGGGYYFDDGGGFDDGFPIPTASAGYSGLQQHEQMDHTSASDYREGKDIQGIPWERLNYSRNQYREMRLKEYKNYQSLTRSCSRLAQECKQVEREDIFYDFHSSTRAVKSTIVHFQVIITSLVALLAIDLEILRYLQYLVSSGPKAGGGHPDS